MIKLTVPHFYNFGTLADEVGESLVNASSWDALRLKKAQSNPFAIPETEPEWRNACESNSNLKERALLLLKVLETLKVSELYSVGAGGACLEYHLRSAAPGLKIHMTDFAPLTVERMKKYFGNSASYERFDMQSDSWRFASGKTLLLSRIDSELSNAEWRLVLRKIHESGAQRILFIPTEFLKVRSLARSFIYALSTRLKLKKTVSRAGYLRNRKAFLALFAQTGFTLHALTPVQDVEIWELLPR